jgi:hypothetical protein
LLAQADFIERPEGKLHEGQELSLETTEGGSEGATPLALVL